MQIFKSICPNLESFAGQSFLFPSILVGRGIKHLNWAMNFNEETYAAADLVKLSQELHNVELLVFVNVLGIPFTSIASLFLSIKFLKTVYTPQVCILCPTHSNFD